MELVEAGQGDLGDLLERSMVAWLVAASFAFGGCASGSAAFAGRVRLVPSAAQRVVSELAAVVQALHAVSCLALLLECWRSSGDLVGI